MKGNPLLRLIFVLLALGGVAWPVCRLTMRSTGSASKSLPAPSTSSSTPASASPIADKTPSPAAATSVTKNNLLQVTLRLRVAPSPLHCSIMQGGCALLTEANLVSPGEYRVIAGISRDQDLLIAAEWADGDPHAVHAAVMIPDHQAPLEKDFWAGRTLEDTFPIAEHPLSSQQ